MDWLSPSPLWATSAPTGSTLFASSGGQPGNWQSPPQAQTVTFILNSYFWELFFFCFILFSLCYSNFNLHIQSAVSFRLSFWAWIPWIPVLWAVASLWESESKSWEKHGQEERGDHTRKMENTVPTFESSVLRSPTNSVTLVPSVHEGQPPGFTWIAKEPLGQPTTKIHDGFLKAGWSMKACFWVTVFISFLVIFKESWKMRGAKKLGQANTWFQIFKIFDFQRWEHRWMLQPTGQRICSQESCHIIHSGSHRIFVQ